MSQCVVAGPGPVNSATKFKFVLLGTRNSTLFRKPVDSEDDRLVAQRPIFFQLQFGLLLYRAGEWRGVWLVVADLVTAPLVKGASIHQAGSHRLQPQGPLTIGGGGPLMARPHPF